MLATHWAPRFALATIRPSNRERRPATRTLIYYFLVVRRSTPVGEMDLLTHKGGGYHVALSLFANKNVATQQTHSASDSLEQACSTL